MKNEILFYYKLKPVKIYQQQDKIVFYVNDKKYILYKIEHDISTLEEIYKLHNQLKMLRVFCHKIILNISGNIATQIKNNKYVLIEISMETRKIQLTDLMYLMGIKIDAESFITIKRENWKKLWERKVDYIERQYESTQNIKDIPKEIVDFFIGVTETCISLINEMPIPTTVYTISHERISPKMNTDEFYNPLNFIIDVRIRDVAEYTKRINGIANKMTLIRQLHIKRIVSDDEMAILFIRILFPSEFFDQSEENTENIKIKNKNVILENPLEDIKKIYLYLKDIINLPNIEWLNT